jgi:hypothetical protein
MAREDEIATRVMQIMKISGELLRFTGAGGEGGASGGVGSGDPAKEGRHPVQLKLVKGAKNGHGFPDGGESGRNG